MKNLTLFLLFSLALQNSFAQAISYEGNSFKKTVDQNTRTDKKGVSYNLDSKGEVEKLLLDRINGSLEFYYAPSFEGPSGFRIVHNPSNMSYALEVKYITNYEEVNKMLSEKYPMKVFSEYLPVTKDMIEQAKVDDGVKQEKRRVESLKLYNIKALSFPVSDRLADVLHKEIVSMINDFKVSQPNVLIFDGYSAIFRTVVNDQVWAIRIHEPLERTLLLSNLCRQIISDAQAGKFNEATYLEKLK